MAGGPGREQGQRAEGGEGRGRRPGRQTNDSVSGAHIPGDRVGEANEADEAGQEGEKTVRRARGGGWCHAARERQAGRG